MLTQYAQEVRDSTPGRFEGEGPITAYAWARMLDGDSDSAGDTDFGWANLMGRHILWGTSTGFITLTRYQSTTEAEAEYHRFLADWQGHTEVWICTDCGALTANGELGQGDRGADEAHASLMADHLGETIPLVLGDSWWDQDFSWHSCDGCGSRLGGFRHHAYILNEDDDR